MDYIYEGYEPAGYYIEEVKNEADPCYINFIFQHKDTKDVKAVRVGSNDPMDNSTFNNIGMINVAYARVVPELYEALVSGDLELEDFKLE